MQKTNGKVCRNLGKRGWSQRVRFVLLKIEKDVYIEEMFMGYDQQGDCCLSGFGNRVERNWCHLLH